jgi:hypothetical protein
MVLESGWWWLAIVGSKNQFLLEYVLLVGSGGWLVPFV